ncbi:Carbonic anhydrase-related protein [Pteropus alecto]|uniref:Carbonic anhydrase-related protein n=1 Tax=Pteropus alecto TaxID=9402 RepID=L5JV15_PTEAL|nr:Carbonic anhydrase-related protein [Pteropus alecto]
MADLSFIEDSVAFPEKEEDEEEEEEEGVEWGYEEGVEWGLVFPDANGEYQSPINLNSREARYDPSLLDVRLSPNYVVCRDCEVTNDGHSIQVILKSKSVLSGGPLPQGHEFELYEVRFHWGRENQRGSEHTVNFKAFPMELTFFDPSCFGTSSTSVNESDILPCHGIEKKLGLDVLVLSECSGNDYLEFNIEWLHLIHWNSTLFGSIDEAVGKPHGIAIIALFVQIGKEHVGLKAVTEILQDIQYKGKSKTIPCFNPNTLLPDPLLRDYWVYEGSLTIPPCSEGVTWILFRYPLTISQLQIEEFRRLRTHVKGAELVEGCDGILGDNFRPTQPLSDRVIRAAFQ